MFKIVPMVNPDGVYVGNTRTNAMGQDLNRHWDDCNRFLHPTIHAVRDIVRKLDDEGRVDLVLDMHAHTSLTGVFLYGNSYDDVYRFERHIVFPKIVGHNCPDYVPENTFFNSNPMKSGTARRFFCSSLNPEANSYTLEVSLLGYEDEDGNLVHYTDDLYSSVGRNIARAFWDYYKIIGYIPMENCGQVCAALFTKLGVFMGGLFLYKFLSIARPV